jgi:glucan phosphorylase
MRSFIEGPRVAYFSMEIGVNSDMPTYSGGLGVLAGDYEERDSRIGMMRSSIGKVAYHFNTHRMMRRYATYAYL